MSDILINLTPHPMHIYGPDCPDRIEPGSVEPIAVIPVEPEECRTRLGTVDLGRAEGGINYGAANIPVYIVRHGNTTNLPERRPGVWYFVALVVALANPQRHDLLVAYEAVRNLDGAMIGCRSLALPVGGDPQ
ncbi:hypothetical protein AB0B94_30385 [Micromonospora sp. NPDC048986]|uniref:hypothetical protein n=1 Tax=Micromonospora sp. NPDC048986 TaxID=3155644 RepID=UPI00340CF351